MISLNKATVKFIESAASVCGCSIYGIETLKEDGVLYNVIYLCTAESYNVSIDKCSEVHVHINKLLLANNIDLDVNIQVSSPGLNICHSLFINTMAVWVSMCHVLQQMLNT